MSRSLLAAMLVAGACTDQPPVGDFDDMVISEMPPPAVFTLAASDSSVQVGGTVSLTITLPPAAPGTISVYVPSTDGTPGSICPPVLAGNCLDITGAVNLLGPFQTTNGSVTFDYTVPAGSTDAEVQFQGVVLQSGAAYFSNAIELAITAAPSGVVEYGNVVPFADSEGFTRDYLLGQQISIPSDGTLTELGVVVTSANNAAGRLALYSDAGGQPGALVAGSTVRTMINGTNLLSVTPTPILAGDYWLLGNYDANVDLGVDVGGPLETVAYTSLVTSAPLPTLFPTPSTYDNAAINYFVRLQIGAPSQTWGHLTPFGGSEGFSPGYLLGQAVTVGASTTVTDLGVFVTSNPASATGQLALYTDAGGSPGTLLTYSYPTAISLGDNRLPVVTRTAITPGTYWLLGSYTNNLDLGVDISAPQEATWYITYTPHRSGPPTTFGVGSSYLTEPVNYYLAGY